MKNEYLINSINNLNLELPITNETKENLKYKSDYNIILNYNNDSFLNEKEYYNNVKSILDYLSKYDMNYNIEFFVDNRKLFSESDILNQTYDNLNIIVINEEDKYTVLDYIENDEILNDLIKNIKLETLSPLERFVYVYNIVKKYKENINTNKINRNTKYLLESKYKICSDNNKLLKVLLNKVGLSCINVENDLNIVKIDDTKYDVRGIYVNTTNDQECLMTFDKIKESLNLFNFNNKKEFNRNINNLIKYYVDKYDTVNDIIKNIFDEILTYLYKLDYKEYTHLFKKYFELKSNATRNLQSEFESMLDEYYEYMINFTNKEVSTEVIVNAYFNAKVILNEIDKKIVDKVNYNEEKEMYNFPFN